MSLFIASKWEAFKNRGGDPRTSHDFEDIIYVIDNNPEFIDVHRNAEPDVRVFLKGMSKEILSHPSQNEIIECHLNPFTAAECRKQVVEIIRFRLGYSELNYSKDENSSEKIDGYFLGISCGIYRGIIFSYDNSFLGSNYIYKADLSYFLRTINTDFQTGIERTLRFTEYYIGIRYRFNY